MADTEPTAENVERLDQYVVREFPGLSRSAAVHLVEEGKVTVNNKLVAKASYRIKPDDRVNIDYDESEHSVVPEIDLPVIYEDDDCVVINKPAGVLVHSKGSFNPEATVATWLESRWNGPAGERAGIVHRLDRGTSGVMICAKTPEALAWLQKQFSQRKVIKRYVAVVDGRVDRPEAVIDMPIERNPKKPQTFRTGAGGKAALTAYRLIKEGAGRSILELQPMTGRTHQLRVHLSKIGYPIAGDTLYGGSAADRLYLHASALELTLPSRERKTFSVPVPEEFDKALGL